MKNELNNKKAWGFGFLFVTLISLTSVCGAFVIPFRKKKIYKKILMVLIGVAVGCLSGSGYFKNISFLKLNPLLN